MSDRDLDLKLRISADSTAAVVREISNLGAEVTALGGDASKATGEAAVLARQLDELGRTESLVNSFKAARTEVQGTATQLGELQAKARVAGDQQAILDGNLQKTRAALDQTGAASSALAADVQRASLAVVGAEDALAGLKTETDQGVRASESYQSALAHARAELNQKKDALTAQQRALRDVTATEVELERAVRSDEAALAKNRQELDRLTGSVRGSDTALEQQQQRLRQSELSLRAVGVDVTRLSTEERRLQTQAVLTTVAMEDLRRGIASQRDELADVTSKTRQLGDAQQRTQVSAEALGGGFTNLARGVLAYTGVNIGAHLVGDLARQADAVRNVESRLRLATQSQEEFTLAQQGLLRIANDARTSYNETADLYSRVIRSTRELNLTQQQQLDITESISKSLALSGAGAQAQEAALRQLGQALASNVLRGDEFNSVMEQAPRLAQALAAGLNVTVGELRGLAEQGKLTSAQVITALQSQGGAIREEFERLDPTINGAIVKIKNNWGQALSEFDKTNGVSDKAIRALNAVAENMDELIQLATLAGNVTVASLGVKGVQALGGYLDGLRKAEGGALALGAAVTSIGLPLALGLVMEYADDLGVLAAKWTGVDDAAKAAADSRRTQVQAEIDQQTEVVAKYLQYANVQIKTGEEIAKLSDAERETYREAIANRLVLENAERRRAVLMNELGTATQKQVATETAGYQEIRAALAAIDDVQRGVLGQVSERAKRLATDFAEVGADIGKVANEDLANLAARAAADLPTAQTLASQLGAEFFRTGRAASEAGQEIAKRFSEANATVRTLQVTLDAVRAEQLRRLGVDTAAVLTGIDTQTRTLLATFDSLAADGSTDARLIKAAFEELLKKLDTPEELEELKRSLAGVKNPAFDAAAAVGEIEKKLALIPPAADSATGKIESLFRSMGLVASTELERMATQAKAKFDQVVKAGAPLGDQQVVFEKYADAALTAAARRGDYAVQEAALQLQAQAKTGEQRQLVESLTQKYSALKTEAGAASSTAIAGHQGAAQAAASEFHSITQLINARAVLSEADQQRIRDLRAESDALRERNSLVNDANRINDLAGVSAAAASIGGRGAVGFGADGINRLREIEDEIERTIRAGRLAADALGETEIDSPEDIRRAREQARRARGQSALLSSVTGGQAAEARNLASELERGAAALDRAIERYQQAGVQNGSATVSNPGTALGNNRVMFGAGPLPDSQRPAPLPTPQPGATVNINLTINGGPAVSLFGTQSAVDQLVEQLQREQLLAQGGGNG